MTPRALKKIKKGDKNARINQEEKKKVLEDLSKRIKNYVLSSEENFDSWQKELCDDFCRTFYNCALGPKYEPIHFGKGQKIVNMMFKYLYCFDDNNKERFIHCHMPLDKYTLDWFFEKVCPEDNDLRIPWSNLDYGSIQEKGSYCWIQFEIKEYLKKQQKYPKNPLEAEFYIWQEYKQRENKK